MGKAVRVLVTGAGGFVGRFALASLEQTGVDVHAVSRIAGRRAGASVWHQADLLVPSECERVVRAVQPNVVLHLAWTTEHGKFWTSPLNVDWAAATLFLSRAAIEHGAHRFVGVGTCFEYQSPNDACCVEASTPLEPTTLYGVAKDSTRRILQSFADERGFELVWARLFFLYGPGEHPDRLVSSVARALVAGEQARCSSGTAVRDYMDVRDAGAALACAALSDYTGPLNIGSGRAARIADVARLVAEIHGRPELLSLGAIADRSNEPPHIVASTERLERQVGFHQERTLEEGLSDALSYWAAGAA